MQFLIDNLWSDKTVSKFFLFILSWIALLLYSCEDVIDVELEDGETLLVVDGWVTDRPGPYTVTLSTTAPYFSNQATPKVTGAVVEISDDEGNSEVLTEVEDGRYQTQNITGKVGNTYYLKIRVGEDSYEAESYLPLAPPTDSLTYRKEKDDDTEEESKSIHLYYHGPENPGKGDYFRVKIFQNDEFLNEPDDLIYASDEFVDGNYIGDLETANGFETGDKARIELHAITEGAFYFFDEMWRQSSNQGPFSDPPSNIRTNIKTIQSTQFSKAIGFFGTSSVSFKEGIIEGEEGVIK